MRTTPISAQPVDRTGRWLASLTRLVEHAGAGPALAHRKALGLLDQEVWRQATVLAYNHIFALVALAFVLIAPLIFLLPRSSGEIGVETMVD